MKEFNPNFSHINADNPAEFARKMLIEFTKQYAEFAGQSQNALARKTGLHQSNINRVLSGKYSPELDTFLKILTALDLRIELKVKSRLCT